VAKPELGTKRLCASCGAKFYDLSKTPITCPKCGTVFEVLPASTRPRPDQVRPARAPEVAETPEAEEAELISLEEADAEAQGKKATAGDAAEAVEEVEDEGIEDDAEDNTFIEEEEEEDTDVSEIIGGDIADEEET
jgi:uncharacterized protein (TIGR02300 family)